MSEFRKLWTDSPLAANITVASHNIHVNNPNRWKILERDGIHLTNNFGSELFGYKVNKITNFLGSF